jgi:hypothetical protein
VFTIEINESQLDKDNLLEIEDIVSIYIRLIIIDEESEII